MVRRETHKDPTFPPKLKLVLGPHSCPARWYVATFYCRPPWWSLRRRAELSGVTWLVFVGGLATLLSFYTLPISLAIMLTGHIRDIQNVCEGFILMQCLPHVSSYWTKVVQSSNASMWKQNMHCSTISPSLRDSFRTVTFFPTAGGRPCFIEVLFPLPLILWF